MKGLPLFCGSDSNYIEISGGRKFDILKMVLATLILLLHSKAYPVHFLPVLRMAVPLFYIMTSYFFYIKYQNCNSNTEKKNQLLKFTKRNSYLYLFWCLALLPISILLHPNWFEGDAFFTISKIVKAFFFTGFFRASWFILASIYSVFIISCLSNFIKDGWLILLSLIFYFLSCLDSNYASIIGSDFVEMFHDKYFRLCNTFPSAMIWVIIGKILAKKTVIISKRWRVPLLLFSLCFLYIEHLLVRHYALFGATDCYISLLLCCPIIFVLIGQSNLIKGKDMLFCRKASVILYCTHVSIIWIIRHLWTQGGRAL